MDLTDARKRLSASIRAFRDAPHNPSRASIAKDLQVTRESIRLWEIGESFPLLPDLGKIAQYLGTTPAYILFGIEQEMPGTKLVRVTAIEEMVLLSFRELPQEQQVQLQQYMSFMLQSTVLPSNVTPLKAPERK